MTYVSFPGLGIEPFHMDRIAFSIGSIEVNWYGLIIACGMILAVLYAMRHAKIDRVKTDDVVDLALAVIIFGVIGARLYYVIMELDHYIVTGGTFWQNLLDTLYGMIAVWKGGLAIYGGIIGGFIAGFVVAKKKRIRFPVVADIAGPSVIVGQIVGRWGNFVNVEAYGSETMLPWRMGIHVSYDYGETFIRESFVHPTFLYESLWNLIGFVIITLSYKKKKFHGQMFLVYITWYGFGRMLIEGLRTDSLYVGDLRISQFVGAASFIVGTVLLILGSRRAKTKKSEEYTPVYAAAAEVDSSDTVDSVADEDSQAENDAHDKTNDTEIVGEDNDGKAD